MTGGTEQGVGRWVELLGGTAAELVGGRVAIAIRAAVKVWKLRRRDDADKEIGAELERAAGADERPDAARVAGPLDLDEADTLAVDFGLLLLQLWRQSGEADMGPFVEQLSGRVWSNASTYRESLAGAIYDGAEIRMVCRDAGVKMARVSLSGTSENQWFSVLEYARTQPPGLVLFILYLAAQRAPAETALLAWVRP
jgi:hypothetical protein